MKNIAKSLSNLNNITVTSGLGQVNMMPIGSAMGAKAGALWSDGLSVMMQENFKKYEVYESNEDLLVLSCVWHRLRKSKEQAKSTINRSPLVAISTSPTKLLDNILYESISPVDKELARKIRDFYSKKIMMLKLQGQELTKFREDLNKFIHSDGLKFEEKIFGLVYRLPEFYEYDILFDDITLNCTKEINKSPYVAVHTLSLLETMTVNKRRISKRVEYWFKNEKNELANITLDANNPLIKVWDKIVTNDVKLEATYRVKKRDNIQYLTLINYKLV